MLKQRLSNIELLRILAMCGVVVLHYNNTRGGGFAEATGINLWILYVLESFFACAVDLFILITGYFMCENAERYIIKPMKLLIQLILVKEGLYFVKIIVGKSAPSMGVFFTRLLPNNYYIILYITLYFISPLLNIIVDMAIKKKALKKIMIVLFSVFAIYPTIIDFFQDIFQKDIFGISSIGAYGSQWGFTIVNFMLMYMIGAYIRRQNAGTRNNKVLLLKIGISVLILVIWRVFLDKFEINSRSVWEYCNPIIILMASWFFAIFRNATIPSNKLINSLAECSFTVYLTHGSILPFINIKKFVSGHWWLMLGHILISVIAIYILGWILYKAYEFVMRPIYSRLSKRMPAIKEDLYKELS